MSYFSIKQQNHILLSIIILLGGFLCYALRGYTGSVLGAVVLYTIFRSSFVFLVEKKQVKKILATIIIMFVSFLIIVLPFFFLSILIIEKIIEFKNNYQAISVILIRLDKLLSNKFNFNNAIENSIQNIESWIINIFPSAFSGAFDVFVLIVITYFLLYFMFMNHQKFEAALMKYLPFSRTNCERLALELKNITYSNVLGQGLIALTQGFLLGFGFWLFNIPDPVFWGVICLFLSFLPIIGSPMVFVPASIILISNGNSFGGIGILLWGGILVSNIDNVMRLVINKKMADTHPIVSIMGILLGFPIFGILGLVFGPLLLSGFVLLIKMYESGEYIMKK